MDKSSKYIIEMNGQEHVDAEAIRAKGIERMKAYLDRISKELQDNSDGRDNSFY